MSKQHVNDEVVDVDMMRYIALEARSECDRVKDLVKKGAFNKDRQVESIFLLRHKDQIYKAVMGKIYIKYFAKPNSTVSHRVYLSGTLHQ